MLGKTVIWTGKITSIESGDNGGVRVVVHAQTNDVGSAFLDFDPSQRSDFLRLKEKQVIRFTGVIRSFVASPFLENCKLIQVLD